MVRYYSDFGTQIRNEILDEVSLEIFWFIDKKTTYGGRAVSFPQIKSILTRKAK